MQLFAYITRPINHRVAFIFNQVSFAAREEIDEWVNSLHFLIL